MLLLLLSHKTDDRYLEELESTVQHDLVKHRYLMQPTRLMMMKLLHGEYSLTSVQLVKLLNIPWANYSTHVKSLEKSGYVELKDDFDENGLVRQVVVLTDIGKKEYEELYEILQEFMEKKTPLEYILNADTDNYMKDDLYPNE
jgi:DNA-binding MarR family transcriptional regulator